MMTLRDWLGTKGVRWHAQNLTDAAQGSIWQSGRAWIRVSRGHDESKPDQQLFEINPEWHLVIRNAAGLAIQFGSGDGDSGITMHAQTPVTDLYLTFESGSWRALFDRILPGYWFERGTYKHFDRSGPNRLKVNQETEVSLMWRDGAFWWSLWHPTMEWSSKTPRWRSGAFYPLDWLFGHHRYSKREIGTESVLVPMPEKPYPATVTLYEATWQRPRWPFLTRSRMAEISVTGGIPHPGKGENSWDCGDDATFSLSCQARTPEAAVARMVESVLRDRRRYGGNQWRPVESAA